MFDPALRATVVRVFTDLAIVFFGVIAIGFVIDRVTRRAWSWWGSKD